MLTFLGYMFYGIGIADFMGMFFGYDFTGQSWTPILFGGIGQVLIVMEEQKKIASKQNENVSEAESEDNRVEGGPDARELILRV